MTKPVLRAKPGLLMRSELSDCSRSGKSEPKLAFDSQLSGRAYRIAGMLAQDVHDSLAGERLHRVPSLVTTVARRREL